MPGQIHTLEVRASLPPAIGRLEELASNLFYSWDREVRRLFHELDAPLWQACRHNPKLVLRNIAQARLNAAATSPEFLSRYQATLARYDRYMQSTGEGSRGADGPRVAYFCMEFGLHESVGLYSGGLGILAGDYCKAASSNHLPFVAVGLMYREGYLTQRIDASGAQVSEAHHADPEDLPVQLLRRDDGSPFCVTVPFPERVVHARVWRAEVGRVPLLLLDTDTPENRPADRAITRRLYGGDRSTRISQELVLGVGGARALRALGLSPEVWHINEGHPAFLVLECCRERVAAGQSFDAALEEVAAAVVFTTHTPVPAGHDRFEHTLARAHLAPLAAELGVDVERLLALGATPEAPQEFNMTAFSLRASRHCNGVSAIHGRVSARMAEFIWPQVPPEENPMDHVTNGVHVPTVMATAWTALLDADHPEWCRSLSCNAEFWRGWVASLSDRQFWEIRQSLKAVMLSYVGDLLERQYRQMQVGEARIRRMRRALRELGPKALVIGFARRITAYKRPLLLLEQRAWLERLVADRERPVMLVFAGKAHPADGEGQAMIRTLNALAAEPAFSGRLFFVQDYDMALGRILVSGVDLWLNTPDYPQEASGTSGQKAAINGVPNLSVLDGWWAEGWHGDNGWAIAPVDRALPAAQRDRLESEALLALLEDEVLPEFFERNAQGLPEAWLRRSRQAMVRALPVYNVDRMLGDYLERLYRPAAAAARRLSADGGRPAQALADWKRRIREAWGQVSLRWAEQPPSAVPSGSAVRLRVIASPGRLEAEDLAVESVIESNTTHALQRTRERLCPVAVLDGGELLYEREWVPPAEGALHLRVRCWPQHPDLAHPFELGLMTWL